MSGRDAARDELAKEIERVERSRDWQGADIDYPILADAVLAWMEERGYRRSVTPDEKPRVRAASYLSPPDMHRLDWACNPIRAAFREPPYLVGSVLTRPDYRDIDIRLILDDDLYQRIVPNDGVRLLFNVALSGLIEKAAQPPRPIDFQIQSMTEANDPGAAHGMRNPLGVRQPVPTESTARAFGLEVTE